MSRLGTTSPAIADGGALENRVRLTDLSPALPRRDFDARCRLVYLAGIGAREWLAALPHNAARRMRKPGKTWHRLEPGENPAPGATRIALYVHYAASGRISDMVRHQLDGLSRLGFTVVFITMADRIPEQDWQAVRRLAALLAQRENFGLDFGAWQDILPELRRRWPLADELLLANDSVLGPIYPLAPLLDVMRAGGEGLFGLTESLQNRPHLQSYFLLARGRPVVTDLLRFLQDLRITSSKWLLVRRGEIRLSGWMQQRGHRVAALFGYHRLVKAAIADPVERGRLKDLYHKLRDLDRLTNDAAAAALFRWPLNPTHHLWRVLALHFQFPFLKTELIRRNPTGLAGVAEWPSLIPPQSPSPPALLRAHLETLERPSSL